MGWNEILDLLVLFELSIITSIVIYNLIVYNALYFWSAISIAFQYLYRDLLVEFPRATNYDAVSQFFFSDGMRAIELAIGIVLLSIDHWDLSHKVKRELERETSILLQEVVAGTVSDSGKPPPSASGGINPEGTS